MTTSSSGRPIAVALSIIVAVAVSAGLYVAGSPRTAREIALDERRVDDISHVSGRVKEYRKAYGTLPASLGMLDSVAGISNVPRDPATSEPYEYRVTGDSTFVLCATFSHASPDSYRTRYAAARAHPAGSHCFANGML